MTSTYTPDQLTVIATRYCEGLALKVGEPPYLNLDQVDKDITTAASRYAATMGESFVESAFQLHGLKQAREAVFEQLANLLKNMNPDLPEFQLWAQAHNILGAELAGPQYPGLPLNTYSPLGTA